MDYKIVDEELAYETPARARTLVTPEVHAVTPNVKLREWDGVPPYAVLAFVGYLLALAVIFSDQIVPYCVENFAQPENCGPIFDRIFPVAIAAIVLAPAIGGAVQRMGGNRTAATVFSFCAAVMLPLMLGWQYLF